jgi:DeoR family fructose operon transcriptional repressor
LYAEERRLHILNQARRDGRVDAAPLAEQFEVSTETIRRDLTALERQGQLRRTHGGAIPLTRLGFDPLLTTRASAMVEEKRRIGEVAARFLPQEGSVLLDSGSTIAALAERLPEDRPLTVLTNGLLTALTLARKPNLSLLMPGGVIRSRALSVVGPWAARDLADVRVDVAFLGANGVTAERGFSTTDQGEAVTKRAMIASARRVIVLCDHSKFGADDFFHYASPSEVDMVITDSGLDPDLAEELRGVVASLELA